MTNDEQNERPVTTIIVGAAAAVGPGKRHEPDAVADALWLMHTVRSGPVAVLE
ncbi:hypothetical protein [Paramicrobacterium fandaimingii]|uniref:hypothetical protein n=1 Tax=Paramicrobacterium fandaimingii TaxID=2708079 RepID=UPI00142445EA|nr:hypothetical protein [Microbacterium fandaimingii]